MELRVLFEALVSLEWILIAEEKGEVKATYFYVDSLLNRRDWLRKSLPGHAEYERFDNELGQYKEDVRDATDRLIEENEQSLASIDRVLAQEGFSNVAEELTKKRRGWYRPLGPQTFRDLCKETGKLPLYDVLYGSFSRVTHASDLSRHVLFWGQGNLTFTPLRDVHEIDQLIRITSTIVFTAYHLILKVFRPGETKSFSRIYVEHWRPKIQSMPQIRRSSDGSDPINI